MTPATKASTSLKPQDVAKKSASALSAVRHFDAEESPIPEAKCPVPEQVSTTFAQQQERIPQASHQSPPRATTTFGRPAENIAAGEASSDLLDLDVQTSETPAAL